VKYPSERYRLPGQQLKRYMQQRHYRCFGV